MRRKDQAKSNVWGEISKHTQDHHTLELQYWTCRHLLWSSLFSAQPPALVSDKLAHVIFWCGQQRLEMSKKERDGKTCFKGQQTFTV